MSKVSVIIPFYNGVDWLCEAVQSVLEQTYKDLEIIVVNDGSPEDVTKFLDIYGDKVIYHKQINQGPAVARNYAMKIATGDYFAFLDSDDIWLPEKMEKQISLMKTTGAKWSHTGFYYWTPSNGSLKSIDNSKDYDDIYIQTFVSIKIATPCVIVDRKTFEEHPEIIYPENMRKGQDTVYFRELSKYYPIALVKEPLAKIRMRGTNSNTRAVSRFNLKASSYLKYKNDSSIPRGIIRIYSIYYLYSKLFGNKTNKFKEFIAKCFWSLPYIIERVYVKYLISKTSKDDKYILR